VVESDHAESLKEAMVSAAANAARRLAAAWRENEMRRRK